MCAITGIISLDPDDHRLLESMTDALSHRGPDNRGLFHDKFVSLGHRRLSIIDFSANANQPMSNEDGTVNLVCNGEIYNYKEKTSELKQMGHTFRSHSDCEVLIHLYEEYGEDFLDGVNGMYALAIWDSRNRRMLLAVDRFGKKPLYYAVCGERLIFASELKSLLLFKWLKRDLDHLAVDRYLSLRYVPAPLTILKSVKKLEPATLMTWQDGKIDAKYYWAPAPQRNDFSEAECIDSFRLILTDAVRLRLQSDAPVGIYLSGGIDSAAVAGLMNCFLGGKKISYTLSFDYKYDEYQRAKKIADFLDYEFNPVRVSEADFDLMPEITRYMDEPFGDLLCLPAFLLAKKAKEKLRVVLTGDGADEILNGYFHQKLMILRKRYQSVLGVPGVQYILSNLFKAAPLSLLNTIFDYPDRIGPRERIKLSQAVSGLHNFGDFYEGITSCFSRQDKSAVYTGDFLKYSRYEPIADEYQRAIRAGKGFSFLSRLSLLDLKCWIPFSVIYRLDKMNMAHAVETRSPFLDYRVVEAALNLPDKLKINNGRNKEALRLLIGRLYPPSYCQEGKQAFYMPLLAQYRERYNKWVYSLLNRRSLERRGFFRWQYIEILFELSNRGSMLAYRQLTCLAMLELWFRVFLADD